VAARWAGWATAGAVSAGAALSGRRRPAAHRPAGSTRAAASLVVAAAVMGCSLGAAGALSGLLGTVNAGAGTPPAELAPPAIAMAVSVAVVVLVLVPATARDFRSAGRPPAPRRPGST
jgi:hypothetical protein